MADLDVRRCRPFLGTFVEIAGPAGSEAAVATAFDAVAHVHARMSFHDEGSDLAALRRAAPGDVVAVDRQTVEVLRIAAALHRRSRGLFDVTVGAQLADWGLLPGSGKADPDATAESIEILDDRHIRCRHRVLIDLGGIAKGFAVDRAVAALAAAGVRSALVNAGGDLRILGDNPQTIWLRGADGAPTAAVALANAAVATSASVRDSRTPGVSPHIGYGRAACFAATPISVIAPTCVIADAMTKIAIADRVLAEEVLAECGGALVSAATFAMAA